jgi:hypothetical protein
MSPKSVQRFWVNDMHQTNGSKRVARITIRATRFSAGMLVTGDNIVSIFVVKRIT